MSTAPRVLIIPGLNGHPGMLMHYAPQLFPSWQAHAFNHHADLADDGVEGLARRALETMGTDDAPWFVCGESFGGTVALTLAYEAPQRVRGLVLLSTFGWYPSTLARRSVRALTLWSLLGGRVGTPLYRVGRLASMPSQLGLRFSRELLRSYIDRPRADVVAYRRKVELSLSFDARPWLPSIRTPTFILGGSWDPVVPGSARRELAQRLPDAVLRVLPGGHLVHLVQARRVGELIDQWACTLH